MANKEEKTVSIVTLPLKTEKWQADRLDKKFEICRSIYNAMLGRKLKDYNNLQRLPRYKELSEIIKVFYEDPDTKKRKSPECKAALQERNSLLADYGFTKYGIGNLCTLYYKHFNENISSIMANLSIAQPLWKSIETMLYGTVNGKGQPKFKRYGDWNSIASDGKSGIRLVDKDGATLFAGSYATPMFIYIGTQKGKSMTIPVILPRSDSFKHRMMDRKIHTIRIVRKIVNGTSRYSVQLCVDGVPAEKLDKKGNNRHPIGRGRVGIYIDTRTVTAVTETGDVHFYHLNEGIESAEEEITKLRQHMSASRVLTNPDNFEPDGTIKKGHIVQGRRMPLTWTYSNSYKQSKKELSDILRKEKERRTLERQKLANELLGLGDTFFINDYPFALSAQRKKETELKKDGTPKSKAKAGKAIGENAPAMLITLLTQKVAATYGPEPELIKMDAPDKAKKNYREDCARQLLDIVAK